MAAKNKIRLLPGLLTTVYILASAVMLTESTPTFMPDKESMIQPAVTDTVAYTNTTVQTTV